MPNSDDCEALKSYFLQRPDFTGRPRRLTRTQMAAQAAALFARLDRAGEELKATGDISDATMIIVLSGEPAAPSPGTNSRASSITDSDAGPVFCDDAKIDF